MCVVCVLCEALILRLSVSACVVEQAGDRLISRVNVHSDQNVPGFLPFLYDDPNKDDANIPTTSPIQPSKRSSNSKANFAEFPVTL